MSDTLEVSRLEAVGEIIDEFTGKRWAVPTDNCEDLADYNVANPMAMPESRQDKRFVYMWVRENQWVEYNAMGAVRVTVKEFTGDEPSPMDEEYGKPLTSYVVYEGAYLIKMPRHIAEASWRQQDEEAKLAMSDVYKPRRTQKSDGARGTVEEGTEATVTVGEIAVESSRRSGQRRS